MNKVNAELGGSEKSTLEIYLVELFNLGFPGYPEETNILVEILEIYQGRLKDRVSNNPITPDVIKGLVHGYNLAEYLLDSLLHMELGLIGDCKFGLQYDDRRFVGRNVSVIADFLSKEIEEMKNAKS